MPVFASQAWFEAFEAQINASSEYRDAASDWEGDIAFRILAEPDRGVPEDLWGYLDLWHGSCRGGRAIASADAEGGGLHVDRAVLPLEGRRRGRARPDQGR